MIIALANLIKGRRDDAAPKRPAKSRAHRAARRFLRNEDGSPALEFGLIAPIFFGLIFSLYDMGLAMLRQVMLNQATEREVRDFRLNPRPGGDPLMIDEFISDVCKRALIFSDCQDTMLVKLEPVPDSGVLPNDALDCTVQRDSGGNVIRPQHKFDPSKPATLTYLRVCVPVKPLIPGMGVAVGFEYDGNSQVHVVATTAYMSE